MGWFGDVALLIEKEAAVTSAIRVRRVYEDPEPGDGSPDLHRPAFRLRYTAELGMPSSRRRRPQSPVPSRRLAADFWTALLMISRSRSRLSSSVT